jgi:hypothetical protein
MASMIDLLLDSIISNATSIQFSSNLASSTSHDPIQARDCCGGLPCRLKLALRSSHISDGVLQSMSGRSDST